MGNLNPFRYRGYYYDTESQLYYLMTRYYDPVTHRFINADGYYQSGDGILDTNMNAYCRNNPANCMDSTGNVVFVFGLEGGVNAGVGVNASAACVFDLEGNIGFQVSYGPTAGFSFGFNIGPTIGIIGDADTIYDLEKPCSVLSGSVGDGVYAGLSLLHFDDRPDSEYNGIYLSAGGVASPFVGDVQLTKPETTTTWGVNIFGNETPKKTNSQPSGKKPPPKNPPKQYCSGCGRPIGTGPGKCSGGW